RWVIIATDRLGRPREHTDEVEPQRLADCPFCAGHEYLTLTPTYVEPDPDHWLVRVVPNTFPAVSGENPFLLTGLEMCIAGPASGQHEVAIACPQHESSLARLPAANIAALFGAFR